MDYALHIKCKDYDETLVITIANGLHWAKGIQNALEKAGYKVIRYKHGYIEDHDAPTTPTP